PHRATTPNAFRSLPATDSIIAQLALAAIAAEYRASRPTLLLLSFSTSDVVGHVFGPDSWEAWDQLPWFDRVTGAFLAAREARVGTVNVILAADHGNVSMPEAQAARDRIPACRIKEGPRGADPYERPCVAGHRIGPRAASAALQAAAEKVLGPGSWILG